MAKSKVVFKNYFNKIVNSHDPKRLIRISKLLLKAWKRYPSLRLGQFLYYLLDISFRVDFKNGLGIGGNELFYIEDAYIERMLKREIQLYKKIKHE